MTSVERVKAICKERKIPIYRLEQELGFANGYIGQLRKGVFPADRLSEIAKYLSVSIEYLLGVEDKEKKPVTDDDIKFALFGGAEDITDDMYDEVKNFAEYIKQREINKKK